MKLTLSRVLFGFGCLATTVGCAHRQQASVLPQGDNTFEIIGLGEEEQEALERAEAEARYTCHHDQKKLKVLEANTTYQGVDKEKDVSGKQVALAVFTGRTGREARDNDYRVSLKIECI